MKSLYLILAPRCFENADAFILLFVLEFGPLANVAHGVPPVPVFNCELLDGPGPRWGKSPVLSEAAVGVSPAAWRSLQRRTQVSALQVYLLEAELFHPWLWGGGVK